MTKEKKSNATEQENRQESQISKQIRASRLRQGLTLRALADKLGWKYQLIQRIEKDGKCSVKSLQAISNALQQGFWIFPENISK